MLELRQLPLLQEADTVEGRNRHPDVLVPRLHLRNPRPPSGAPPSGIEVISTGITQTVAPLPHCELAEPFWHTYFNPFYFSKNLFAIRPDYCSISLVWLNWNSEAKLWLPTLYKSGLPQSTM